MGQLYILSEKLYFPPPEQALADGLIAAGGDLSPERLLLAYRSGIFPWFDDGPPLWWNPDPRFVLWPHALKVSKSMKQQLKRNAFEVKENSAFPQVVRYCREQPRPGQDGTWINDEVEDAYIQLHKLGYAHSFESYRNGELAGGLYGVRLGNVFFGESMFSHQTNASKYAFIKAVECLQASGVKLIDCQVYTGHLESLGAGFITRERFLACLQEFIPC